MTFLNTRGPAGGPRRGQLPNQLAPMLAGVGQPAPVLAVAGALPRDDDGWAFEMKWDGVRAHAYPDGGQLRLASRTDRDITIAYPELAAPGSAAASPLLLDGGVGACDEGRRSFAQLQQRMHVTSAAQAALLSARIPVSSLIFDVLQAAGHSL